MLLADCQAILESSSIADLSARAVRAAHSVGFAYMSLTQVQESPGEPTTFTVLAHNTPASYLAIQNDPALGRRDPVSQHERTSALPIAWSRAEYVAAGLVDKWEEQARHGYAEGVSQGFHLSHGRHYMYGMDGPKGSLPLDPVKLARVVADASLVGVYCQVAAERLTAPRLPIAPRLTPREREALSWTLVGKTAWEAGMIMRLSERTTNQYLGSAMRKLGCVNKHQAAVRALDLGLIHG